MIYLDNSATTQVFPECNSIIARANEELFYNPSAGYAVACEVSAIIERARANIASYIGAEPHEIIFTSCATESNNMVVKGAFKNKKGELVISAGEHPSVYNPARREKMQGASLVELRLGQDGCVVLDGLNNPSLVSIIHVSNVTGAVNNIADITAFIKRRFPSAVVHSDGVQAVGKIDVNVKQLGVDLYSFSGHKFHAPKGVGVLYVRKGFNINPLILGGSQEAGLRGGTENVSGILALEYALGKKIANKNTASVAKINNYFCQRLGEEGFVLNTSSACVPHILSVICPNVFGENLMRAVSARGVVVGIGSACTAKNPVATHLLGSAKNYDSRHIIRLSFDEYTCFSDVERATDIIIEEYKGLK